jgi:branched-chain amino acid transport system permease protein
MSADTRTEPEPTHREPGAFQRRLMRVPVRRLILWILAILLILGVFFGSWSTLRADFFSGADWRNFVINGIARGSVYALIAMGYTLVYGILFLINFAHGEVFMAGTFTTFFLARWMGQTGFLGRSPILAILLMFLCSMTVSMTIAVMNERIAYRPLRGSPRLVPLITAIGMSLFLQNSFRGFYGADANAYPTIEILRGTWTILGSPVQKSQLVVIVAAALLMMGLFQFITRTKTGRAMRAVGEDKEIASLMGIDVDKTIVTTFALGGLLAGAAGILFIFLFNQVKFDMGFFPGIKAFTAAVLGGIGNVVGAGLGGLALGIMEAVGPFLFLTGAEVPSPNQLQPIIAFGILVLVLIFRPGGILGTAEEQRA